MDMCLSLVMTDKDKDKWLKGKKGKNLTCYKVVKIWREKVFEPPYFGYAYNFGRNKIEEPPIKNFLVKIEGKGSYRTYIPFFHLFYEYESALEWTQTGYNDNDKFIVKCYVPKTCIEYVGEQRGDRVIVATEFTFA